MFFIMIFIALLNAVALALIYYCLEDMDKKDKVIFIAVGIAVIYMLTTFIYWISTNDIEIEEVSEQIKNLILFLFVPINSIIVVPLFAKSYRKYKTGKLKKDKLRNRCIVLVVILFVILMIELSYFKDIQSSIVKMIEQQQEEINEPVIDNNELVDTEENGTTGDILNAVEPVNSNTVE